VTETKLQVQRAAKDEVFKDMVRVHEDYRTTDNGRICRITVNDRSTLASIRGLETAEAAIRIDEHLRSRLKVAVGQSYTFALPEMVERGQLRPLRDPKQPMDEAA